MGCLLSYLATTMKPLRLVILILQLIQDWGLRDLTLT
jgi:hypothetical protein